MRHFVIFLVLCAVFCLPIAAQATGYQPPSADEKRQLERQRTSRLADIRAGDEVKRGGMTLIERDGLVKLADAQSEAVTNLRMLRAGNGDHWGWYVVVPVS